MSGRWVIGIDEAGYGPSMGPLVLGGVSCWLPHDISVEQMTDLLAPEIQPIAPFPKKIHIPIGDSKQILKGKYGWANLSFGAEWLLENCMADEACVQSSHSSQFMKLIHEDAERLQGVPWYRDLFDESGNGSLPNFSYLDDTNSGLFSSLQRSRMLRDSNENVQAKLGKLGIRLGSAQVRVIDEIEFNRLVLLSSNKSNVLSDNSLHLAKSLAIRCLEVGEKLDHEWSNSSLASIEVYCDKHGGRNRYQPVLMGTFDEAWFDVAEEGPVRSRYKGKWKECELAFQFMAKGDTLFPSAAASVLAKWVREICMGAINQFWEHENGSTLRPTAGYYVDATRFASEIEATAIKIKLPRETWWRIK